MADRTEGQIMALWEARGAPLVSVVCVTYNHEGYIEDAIKGFLIQETAFPFEVIIHDDASTDATRKIIAQYACRYPSIIKPLFQSENQHSKGRNCFLIACSQAMGEYIALCDGDDYWTCPQKLQIQVTEMLNHPQSGMSFHSAILRHADTSARDESFCRHADRNRMFSARDIILRDGAFMPSSSICLRRDCLAEIIEGEDAFFSAHMYDYFLQIIGSLKGGALYIDREMSVYRYMNSGSWTHIMTTDGDYFLNWMRNNIRAIKTVDAMTGARYTKEFLCIIKKRHGSILRSQVLSKTFRRGYFTEQKREIGILNILLWHTVYKHDLINSFLIGKLPLLRRIRSALLSCRFAAGSG